MEEPKLELVRKASDLLYHVWCFAWFRTNWVNLQYYFNQLPPRGRVLFCYKVSCACSHNSRFITTATHYPSIKDISFSLQWVGGSIDICSTSSPSPYYPKSIQLLCSLNHSAIIFQKAESHTVHVYHATVLCVAKVSVHSSTVLMVNLPFKIHY